MTKRWCYASSLALTFCPRLAAAQALAGGGGPDISVFRVIFAFVTAAAAAFGLALFLRARSGHTIVPADLARWVKLPVASRQIEVLETRRISVHADLCLIRNNGSEWLLACGPAGITILRSCNTSTPPAGGSEDARGDN